MVGAPLTPLAAGPATGSTGERYAPGTVLILRELIDHRVRSARPLQVVEDGDAGLAAYLVPRSEVAWPRLADGEQSQTPDQGWLLRREEWQGPGCLFVFPPGEAYAAVLFFDRDDHRPLSWKVDFLRPPTRNGACLDTLDWALDLLVPLDRRHWTVKDTDDLAQLRLLELLGPGGHRQVGVARARAERAIAAAEAPFDDRWLNWRPPPEAAALRLPGEIFRFGDQPRGGARTGAAPSRAPLRSGSGTTVLDAAGRTWLDLDLGGGQLVHGHAHPAVVGAVTRQLGLGLGAEADHLPGRALGAVLARRLGCAALRWTASGGSALAAAVALAQCRTGRRLVAHWGAGSAEGTNGRDAHETGFLDLDEGDPAATLARLRAAGDELAAIVVDPLALTSTVGAPQSVERDRTALLEQLRTWSAVGPVVVVADERRGVGAGPAGGCRRLGLVPPLTVLGEGWFGGYGGGAVLGRDDLLAALDGSAPGWSGDLAPRPPVAPPHPVIAIAGLATLDLLDASALADLGARAQQLRDRFDLPGLGWAFRLPPGAGATLRHAGVHAPGRWGFLATVCGDDEVERLAAALAASPLRAQAPPSAPDATSGGTAVGPRRATGPGTRTVHGPPGGDGGEPPASPPAGQDGQER